MSQHLSTIVAEDSWHVMNEQATFWESLPSEPEMPILTCGGCKHFHAYRVGRQDGYCTAKIRAEGFSYMHPEKHTQDLACSDKYTEAEEI